MNNVFTAKLLQNLQNKKGDKGFTLIELLVVVIIIGVLAAVALPNLLGQVAKGRQSEARNTLGAINRTQQAHRLEFGTFGELGAYTQAAAGGPVALTTPPAATNSLPLSLQLEYYQVSDAVVPPTPGIAGISAIAADTFQNDILDYVSQVTQDTNGAFASIICEEPGINGAVPAGNGADAGGAITLATACNSGREIK